MRLTMSLPKIVCATQILGIGMLIGFSGWQRRWIADDGLIVLRTVRNLLAGNGPVFNQGERVEVNTSTVWTYLEWAVAYCIPIRLEYIALAVALICGICAGMIATYATTQWYRWYRYCGEGSNGYTTCSKYCIPLGICVYLAIPPARDFITSGLEVSCVILWLALLWFLTLRWLRNTGVVTSYALAFWAGLSALVRPDIVVIALPILVLIFRYSHGLRQKFFIICSAGFLPVAYEVFRLGYYGLPVPNTAIAKDANQAKWAQGWAYFCNLEQPYQLWIPAICFLLCSALFVGLTIMTQKKVFTHCHDRSHDRSHDRTILSAQLLGVPTQGTQGTQGTHRPERPRHRWHRIVGFLFRPTRQRPSFAIIVCCYEVAAVVHSVYWVRQGADFMHGRVLLPAIFTALLPVMAIPVAPVTEWRKIGVAAVSNTRKNKLIRVLIQCCWIGYCGLQLVIFSWCAVIVDRGSIIQTSQVPSSGIVDERTYYAIGTGHEHPVTVDDYMDYLRIRVLVLDVARHRSTTSRGIFLPQYDYLAWSYIPIFPQKNGEYDLQDKDTVYYLNLGAPSMVLPLGVRIIDPMGLAYPLAAHSDRESDSRIGHDKNLPIDWLIAQYHAMALPGMNKLWIYDARNALQCPMTRKLIDSYSAQLTWARFKQNIKYSFQMLNYSINRNPEYEYHHCRSYLPHS